MVRIIQVLLSLVCAVVAEAQLHLPFFDHIPGLPRPARPSPGGPATRNNVGYNGYDTWFQHFGNPDERSFNSDNHERDKSYEDYDPFYHRDPYFQGNGWDQMPGINNVFNIPNPGYNNHRHQPSHKENNPQEKPKQDHKDISNAQNPEKKPKEVPPIDKSPTEENKVPKLNEDNIPEVTNNSDLLPPKTNEIPKEDEIKDKDDKQVGLNKKKDFLLVGQGNNGNNVYLLHENNPNLNAVVTPNTNQPGNNIIYVPYNPGQSNNPVYQVINGQPSSLPTNIQMAQDKAETGSGYINGVPNSGQAAINSNAGDQNPGYVTIYSNGQLIQIPGVVVNTAPNNVPIQNGNQGQGTNYIIANAVPNNVQTVPSIQNPNTNVIYATIPNQAYANPVYVQLPKCVNAISNGCSSGTIQGDNNGLPSNVIAYQANPNTVAQPAATPNDVSNTYVQPNMVANQGQGAITVAIPNTGPYQQAAQLPVNSGSNGYNQPIVYQRQGQNVPNQGPIQVPSATSNKGYNQPTFTNEKQELNAPNQGVMYNQYTPQPAVPVQPVYNGINSYNQPMVSNQAQEPNLPNQGVTVNNQNTPSQPAVEIPIPNGYNVNPPVTNPSPTIEIRNDVSSNQNVQPQPAVTVDGGTNGYQQPQVLNQGNPGTNAIVNTPNNGEVINQESDNAQPLATSSLVLDSNNLSSLGAQPAIMISNFKDKSGDKEDKKKSKDKKEKKDKAKKKDKKPNDDDKLKVPEPFTNKNKDKR